MRNDAVNVHRKFKLGSTSVLQSARFCGTVCLLSPTKYAGKVIDSVDMFGMVLEFASVLAALTLFVRPTHPVSPLKIMKDLLGNKAA
jgi:hypothetical protein